MTMTVGLGSPKAGSSADFADPFMDIASTAMPQSIKPLLYWAEYLWNSQGTYAKSQMRVISYFLTDIQFDETSDDEREKWDELALDDLDLKGQTQLVLRDRAAYGNAFTSVLVPFTRFLGCKGDRCGALYTLKEVYEGKAFNFTWECPEFKATCPICKYRGSFRIHDEAREQDLTIKHWPPHEIELLHDVYSGDTHYLWRIPEDYKRQVRQGTLFHLERVEKEVLKAIAHNQMFRFRPESIFHVKEPTLSGVINRGWGIPNIYANFRQLFYVQVLRRFNEAIAMDYVIPFRIITPAQRQGAGGGGSILSTGDPMATTDGATFRSQALRMIRQRRRDPAGIQVFPFPVNFQMFGADANQLAPKDLLDQGFERLLNDCGTPVDMFNGNLQLQAAPVALRLFESEHHDIPNTANRVLRYWTDTISRIRSWEEPKSRFTRVTIADNLEKQMMDIQLMQAQQLSGMTAFRGTGHNWRQEQIQMADEAKFKAELEARTQEEMQQAGFAQQIAKGQADPNAQGADPAQGGGQPQGGSQAAGPATGTTMQGPVTQYIASMGPNTPQSPNDMLAAADSIVNDLLGMPDAMKNSQLRELKQANPTMHSIVVQRLEQKRNEVKSQAGAMALQQQQQQGGQ